MENTEYFKDMLAEYGRAMAWQLEQFMEESENSPSKRLQLKDEIRRIEMQIEYISKLSALLEDTVFFDEYEQQKEDE